MISNITTKLINNLNVGFHCQSQYWSSFPDLRAVVCRSKVRRHDEHSTASATEDDYRRCS